jgi:hypothetical protein
LELARIGTPVAIVAATIDPLSHCSIGSWSGSIDYTPTHMRVINKMFTSIPRSISIPSENRKKKFYGQKKIFLIYENREQECLLIAYLIPEAGILSLVLIISLQHGKLAEVINIAISTFHKMPMISHACM